MVVLGLVLLLICVVLGAGAALSNPEPASLDVFGVGLTGLTVGGLVLLGVAIGLVAMLALGMVLTGLARKRAKRQKVKQVGRERETLAEENARLQAELEGQHGGHGAPTYPQAPVAPPSAVSPPTTSGGRQGTAL
jgi:H+/gluconate symporter-like permease